jgi:dynein heavy chain
MLTDVLSCCAVLHTCRAPEGRLFRPYDLLVVARESLGLYDEYFTISANGVMTIRKGVQAEFVPLAEWVRQQSLFDSVSAIGFYRNYITGRAFRRWHSVSAPGKHY